MSFEVDHVLSAWAHIALCADPTWTPEPRDAFTVANQRLLAQHYKISQVFSSKSLLFNQRGKTENGSIGVRSVKDVIPESRLAQFYGDFCYDDARENCYLTLSSNKFNDRSNISRYENSDHAECWMLPEVEYWFRKLTHDTSDRHVSSRRRHCKTLVEEEFERWASSGERAREESALEARIRGVRALWHCPPPSFSRGSTGTFVRDQSPPAPRKMRARRRQPRRLAAQQNAALSNQLLCSSPNKLDISRQPPLNFRRALGRFANSYQTATKGSSSRRAMYRNAQVCKATGLTTTQKLSETVEKKHDHSANDTRKNGGAEVQRAAANVDNTGDVKDTIEHETKENVEKKEVENTKREALDVKEENNKKSAVATNSENERKKRLYSTVLSMTPPSPIVNPAASTRPHKFTPGLVKLNPKVVFLTRPRTTNSSKFEELEKQALEQYKPSDESIDTKFRELERQAEEQYSPSNSNTSCGSQHNKVTPDQSCNRNKKRSPNSNKEKPVDSVIIYSQNFPDLNSKGRTKSIANLKNLHIPPRGEKKEKTHRTHRTLTSAKHKTQRAASDTEYYEGQNFTPAVKKKIIKWKVQAKKRHLSFSTSNPSSDEEAAKVLIKDARLPKKKISNKSKMINHGAGDLQKSKFQH